eukprot:TRINITY_DN30940_c0_g1_i2.p1 TRINITY_DN30940_c0_g1~~TRINITY_DN30940_c0_g1_i2.p1  ORF type:complete len:1144 (+),score=227.72 TRINITY_DN30940_c0_g1_i2:194-3625(+)
MAPGYTKLIDLVTSTSKHSDSFVNFNQLAATALERSKLPPRAPGRPLSGRDGRDVVESDPRHLQPGGSAKAIRPASAPTAKSAQAAHQRCSSRPASAPTGTAATARPATARPSSARPASAHPAAARPASACPATARPASAYPARARPASAPSGAVAAAARLPLAYTARERRPASAPCRPAPAVVLTKAQEAVRARASVSDKQQLGCALLNLMQKKATGEITLERPRSASIRVLLRDEAHGDVLEVMQDAGFDDNFSRQVSAATRRPRRPSATGSEVRGAADFSSVVDLVLVQEDLGTEQDDSAAHSAEECNADSGAEERPWHGLPAKLAKLLEEKRADVDARQAEEAKNFLMDVKKDGGVSAPKTYANEMAPRPRHVKPPLPSSRSQQQQQQTEHGDARAGMHSDSDGEENRPARVFLKRGARSAHEAAAVASALEKRAALEESLKAPPIHKTEDGERRGSAPPPRPSSAVAAGRVRGSAGPAAARPQSADVARGVRTPVALPDSGVGRGEDHRNGSKGGSPSPFFVSEDSPRPCGSEEDTDDTVATGRGAALPATTPRSRPTSARSWKAPSRTPTLLSFPGSISGSRAALEDTDDLLGSSDEDEDRTDNDQSPLEKGSSSDSGGDRAAASRPSSRHASRKPSRQSSFQPSRPPSLGGAKEFSSMRSISRLVRQRTQTKSNGASRPVSQVSISGLDDPDADGSSGSEDSDVSISSKASRATAVSSSRATTSRPASTASLGGSRSNLVGSLKHSKSKAESEGSRSSGKKGGVKLAAGLQPISEATAGGQEKTPKGGKKKGGVTKQAAEGKAQEDFRQLVVKKDNREEGEKYPTLEANDVSFEIRQWSSQRDSNRNAALNLTSRAMTTKTRVNVQKCWESEGPAPQWLTVDFGSKQLLSCLKLRCPGDHTSPKDLQILRSTTDSPNGPWVPVTRLFLGKADGTQMANPRYSLGFDGGVPSRYWKLLFHETWTPGDNVKVLAPLRFLAEPLETYQPTSAPAREHGEEDVEMAVLFSEEVNCSAEERDVRKFARELDMPLESAEAIWKQFQKYDASGLVYEEFVVVVNTILGVKDSKGILGIPEKRLAKLWKEVDPDSKGRVEFVDFTCWFFEHFLKNERTQRSYQSAGHPRSAVWDRMGALLHFCA